MRFWSPIPKMLHGRSTSVARTSRIRRWCLRSHWFRAKAGRRFILSAAKLNNNVRHALEEFTDVRAPDDLARDLGKFRDKIVRLDQSSAADAFTRLLADHGRQTAARRRPDCTVEGDEESRRDRRQPRRPQARWRGGRAVSGLARQGSAVGQAHRNRRSGGAGKFPPRHRGAQGYLLPNDRRRGTEWRDRALPRHARVQPAHRQE